MIIFQTLIILSINKIKKLSILRNNPESFGDCSLISFYSPSTTSGSIGVGGADNCSISALISSLLGIN